MENENQIPIRAKVIIEVVGKPKEHVEKAIKAYVGKIKEDSSFVILREDFAEPLEKGSLWSTFVELEMAVDGITELVGFCFDYMPSSVDIIKPESISLTSRSFNAILNDLQAKLHNVDMVAKNRAAEIDLLRRNLKTTIENMVVLALVNREFELQELSKLLNMGDEELKPFVDDLEKNNKVKKEGLKYTLADGKQGKN
ncbi:hypothetical protein HY638_01520 [Candidatus Woesearchaeota archaeon]|nr:hypothetical protein [Candidatus Woesearchaeota archaeon]